MKNEIRSIEQSSDLEAVYVKVARRIIPFLVLLFVVAWLDRVNVGFARLQMLTDLRFSEAAFGFGAGVFYFGYLLFEVPSNLLLERIGARKTISRIAILWGTTSIMTMFVQTTLQFYFLRFMLGVFEAGLYPGVILYLTYWFPARRRARILGLFMTSVPIAGIIGGPISGWIMATAGGTFGLANWQCLFLFEGIPSILLGVLTLLYVVDGPKQANWLSTTEKQQVRIDLEADQREGYQRKHRFSEALAVPQVWLLVVIYFCVVSANPTLGFYGPTIISGLGVKDNVTIGLLSAVPYFVSIFGAIWVGRHSDRMLERRYHCALSCLCAAAGLVMIGVFSTVPILAFTGMIVSVTGVLSAFAPFWQMPSAMLTGTAAAGGIALINSIGNLSGWFGPSAVGWLKDVTGKTSAGLYVVAGLEVLATILILTCMPRPRLKSAAE